MKLVILFGPQAVGKMTVGQELEKLTGLRLFHNHMTIELVAPFFSYGSSEGKRLVNLFREEIFKAVAKSDLPGLIFTYVWAFDSPSDRDYLEKLRDLFLSHGGEVYFVELAADYDARLARNATPNRLAHKPSKRDLEKSDEIFKNIEGKYRLNSLPGEVQEKNYLRIDNTSLPPDEVARQIKEALGL